MIRSLFLPFVPAAYFTNTVINLKYKYILSSFFFLLIFLPRRSLRRRRVLRFGGALL